MLVGGDLRIVRTFLGARASRSFAIDRGNQVLRILRTLSGGRLHGGLSFNSIELPGTGGDWLRLAGDLAGDSVQWLILLHASEDREPKSDSVGTMR